MSGSARMLLVALLATAALAATAGTAGADTIGPIRLLSKDSVEQAAEAAAPAISADGRYVAFQGAIGGLLGIFREEIATGAMVPVYTVDSFGNEILPATAPSISADGRYVSFTTTAQLDPADDLQAGTPDVYVADLASTPPTYELASALDRPGALCGPGITQPAAGGPDGIAYTGSGGSIASGRVSLSTDGRQVVFVTTAPSDLTEGPGGSTPGVATPAGQVVVHDLSTGCSALVSAEREAATGTMTDLPVAGGGVFEKATAPQYASLHGASISADGSTVAWLGVNLPAQVPVLADEAQKMVALASPGATPYDEPLWRRIGEGVGAATRRIVGGGDPLAPGCPGTGGTLAEPACQGPFPDIIDYGEKAQNQNSSGWLGAGHVDGVPQLSADGYTVALLGNPTSASNAFLVDMHPGLDRKQAVHQLTRQVPVKPSDEDSVVNLEQYLPENGHVFDLAISPDGEQIAFATARQQFPLAPPNLITPAPAGVGQVELYLVDLEGETLQRITHGYKGIGEASQGVLKATEGAGATSPSFGAGGRLAFASTAANLVENDGNNAADVFMVEVSRTAKSSGGSEVSQAPAPRRLKSKRLLLTASSLPSGKVRLVAFVPAAGRLRAAASGTLEVGAKARPLAKARAKAKAVGKVEMMLALHGRMRHLAREPGGFYATARVAFRARSGGSQERHIQVRFDVHKAKHKTKSKHHGSGG